MHTYIRPDSASYLKRPSSSTKTGGDKVRSASEPEKVVCRATEELTDIASWLTLDDFGGRSDALGG
jgi:hypothetical protein